MAAKKNDEQSISKSSGPGLLTLHQDLRQFVHAHLRPIKGILKRVISGGIYAESMYPLAPTFWAITSEDSSYLFWDTIFFGFSTEKFLGCNDSSYHLNKGFFNSNFFTPISGKYLYIYMDISKNRGKTHKMDGL